MHAEDGDVCVIFAARGERWCARRGTMNALRLLHAEDGDVCTVYLLHAEGGDVCVIFAARGGR